MAGKRSAVVLTACCLLTAGTETAWADWQAGAKVAADSNVTRSVDGGKADQYLLGSLAFSGGGTGEERLDWTYAIAAEGALYADVDALNYGALTVSPGLLYHLSPSWTASVVPFLRFRLGNDSDQSATAFGLGLALRQQLSERLYAEERYTYTDSSARADVFSYSEHALGLLVGATWTSRFWTEFGYGFARGDSFRTLDTQTAPATPAGGGMGHGRRGGLDGSSGSELVSELVSTHSLTVTLGLNITSGLAPYAGYTYEVAEGSSGTAHTHIGFLGIGYQF